MTELVATRFCSPKARKKTKLPPELEERRNAEQGKKSSRPESITVRGELMTAEQITTILCSLIVIGLLWIWVQALKKQIGEMNMTIEVQTNTLEAMKTQGSETEKIGGIYRQFVEELPSEIEKYKTLLTELKEDQIRQLKKADEHIDERLKETAEIEIKKLELQQRALDDIPALITQFAEIATTIEQRLSTVDRLVNYMPSYRPATWNWLSAFSAIEPDLLLIRLDNDETDEK
jgi:DNA repair exonuclease SbcCD ATPase subunit